MVEDPDQRRKHLVYATEEEGTTLVREGGHVLGRQVETLCSRVVGNIPSRRHSAEPLTAYRSLVPVREARSALVAGPLAASSLKSPRRSPIAANRVTSVALVSPSTLPTN